VAVLKSRLVLLSLLYNLPANVIEVSKNIENKEKLKERIKVSQEEGEI
jgi:hypothetical protein